MQKFIVVTVAGSPHLVPFNDGVHKLFVHKIDDEPTQLEVRVDSNGRTVQHVSVEETPDEVLRLMDLARGQSHYYLAYIELSRIDFGPGHSEFDGAMEALGFMPYAIMHQGRRLELPQGMYVFDKTLPRNERVKYTLDEARTHIQDAIINLTGDQKYFAHDFTSKPLLTVAEARNVAWG